MNSISEEQFKTMPSLRADARVRMVAIHQHPKLSGSPLTIETSEGHFKVPRVLLPLAKRAYDALVEYEGPDEGCLNELLRGIADRPNRERGRDDLAGAVQGIVDEAVAALKSRVVEAARGACDRAGLLDEAMRAMIG
jgi:hypothetical protein